MELEQKLKILQMYYAAALADSTLRYGNAGIPDKVIGQKRDANEKRCGIGGKVTVHKHIKLSGHY